MTRISQGESKYYFSRLMRLILLTLLCLSISNAVIPELYDWYLDKVYTPEKLRSIFEPLETKYGIKVVYKVDETFLSDSGNSLLPAGPSRRNKVVPIRNKVLVKYPEVLEKALKKYPLKTINRYLNGVYLADEISGNGFSYGGSYDRFRRIVFLIDDGHQGRNYGAYAFHHEFSSLLLSRHSFFLNPWTDQNPKGFVYAYRAGKNKLEVYNNSSVDGTAADYDKGFMNTYGQTSFENDFNEYSAMIFTYPEKFKQIMARHPRVRGKFLVWLKFYQEIDPIFTEEYLLGAGSDAN
jgi:hypothetical protein